MKKKYLILLLAGVLLFYGFKHYAFSVKDEHCLTTQISSRLFDFNSFDLKVDSKLDINDFKVVYSNSGATIFSHGASRKGIKNRHGYCIFDLYYNNVKIYEFGHFKYNNWETNDYTLKVYFKDSKIQPHFDVKRGGNIYINKFKQ